jgi:hypothetical protein
MKLITDYAHLIDRTKDTTTYQHAETLQLFQTVNQVDGNLELFIMDSGVWHSEGIDTPERIAQQVAKPIV